MVRSGANKKSVGTRAVADFLYILCGLHSENAGELLTDAYGPGFVDRPGSFCDSWAWRFIEKGNVDDAPRSGRPRKVQPAAAAAKVLKAGRTKHPEDGFGRKHRRSV